MEASPRIAVYGSSTLEEGEPGYRLARELGAELARLGATVMTGGYDGVMAAASRGAAEAGGHVVGVTVDLFEGRGPANRWVKERIHAPDLFERLRRLIEGADGFVAVEGGLGTLTEVLLAWTLLSVKGRPPAALVLLGEAWPEWLEAHRRAGFVSEPLAAHVQLASTAREAARLALAGVAADSRGSRA
jgi:uncharacterized protein (TIGR00730 family)